MSDRIIDHCFVPQEGDQLLDQCAYPECGKPEIEHEWTVEAYRANPEPPQPIPPLLLQAYRALKDSRNYTPGPSVEAAIAAIEAEYPEAK